MEVSLLQEKHEHEHIKHELPNKHQYYMSMSFHFTVMHAAVER